MSPFTLLREVNAAAVRSKETLFGKSRMRELARSDNAWWGQGTFVVDAE